MGHNIESRSYPLNCDRKAVAADLNHYVAMEDWQEGCNGLVRGIRWLDSEPIAATYEEAKKRIMQLDRGDYDNLAIRYYEAPRVKPERSAGVEKAAQAVNEAQKAYVALCDKANRDFFSTKSAFVGCKSCGSKLAKLRLKASVCPLCGENLLSHTVQERIDSARVRIRNCQSRLDSEHEKAMRRAIKADAKREVKWLLKFEYHT